MRLYLSGKSRQCLGYTPDWLKVVFKNENGEECELTLDIRGEINYENDNLECRVKGEFVPWALYNNETGEDIDFEADEKAAVEFTNERVFEIIKNSEELIVGVYPTDDTNPDYKEDEVIGIEGTLEMNVSESDVRIYPFAEFEVEINL